MTTGVKLSWKLTAADIPKSVDALIEKTRAVYDAVGSLSPDEVNYNNVVKALADSECEYACERNNLDFLQHVATDKEMRDASCDADKKLSEFDVEMSMRQDVFDAIVAFQKKNPAELSEPEAARFVERLIKLGKRNGLHLPKDVQTKIKELKKRMSDLGIDYGKNLNEENTTLEFTEEELAGAPEDFLKGVLKENTAILEELVRLRHEYAKYAVFENDGKMNMNFLNLKFVQVKDADVWHEDVTMYEVRDAKSGELMGYFYLDLYPREGKYGHAACFGIQADTAKVLSELSEKLMGIPSTPGTNMAAAFGHMAGGYDAQYYGYLWSEVFCMDMFYSRFRKEGIMSPAVGADYRRLICSLVALWALPLHLSASA
nr:hypothetical protein BaRGS_033930 [Batillaria attramentaria]